jgi:hypothetical protein
VVVVVMVVAMIRGVIVIMIMMVVFVVQSETLPQTDHYIYHFETFRQALLCASVFWANLAP